MWESCDTWRLKQGTRVELDMVLQLEEKEQWEEFLDVKENTEEDEAESEGGGLSAGDI